DNIKNYNRAKKAVRKAFSVQKEGRGFGFVEFLAACPTNWKMSPVQAVERVSKELIPCFPLGEFKDCTEEDR
ncbi:MAG: 2-oxoglutarate oxidoreductase, partial [Desulfonatronovibrionaceae bacterium]